MAKKRGKSLSQHIRDHLADNPNATPNEIVEALGKKGVKVSPGLASNVKYTSSVAGKRKTKKKRGRKPGAKKGPGRRSAASALSAQNLLDAKKLVDEIGGISAARSAIDALEKLQ